MRCAVRVNETDTFGEEDGDDSRAYFDFDDAEIGNI